MKTIKFKECSTIIENTKDGSQIPCLVVNNNRKNTITCWNATFTERLKILLTGRIWLGVETFGNNVPVHMTTKKNELFIVAKDSTKMSRQQIVKGIAREYHESKINIDLLYGMCLDYPEIKDINIFIRNTIYDARSNAKSLQDSFNHNVKVHNYKKNDN